MTQLIIQQGWSWTEDGHFANARERLIQSWTLCSIKVIAILKPKQGIVSLALQNATTMI